MLKIAYGAAGLAALAALTAGPANAQLLTHKDISLAMAVTMARTAIETCKGQGYNVSVNVLGRNGEVILGLRNELAGPATFENSMKKAYTARRTLRWSRWCRRRPRWAARPVPGRCWRGRAHRRSGCP